MTLTADLCEFALDLCLDDLGPGPRAAVADTTGNALCLMVGAARHPAVDVAAAALGVLDGPEAVPLLGRTERLPAMWAALVHGMAGHVEDFDDTHPPTIIHPGPPVVASALSAAGDGATGVDLHAAVVAGVEVALRVGTALMPAALERGWHMTGIAAPVGAAVAAGRLLGLDASQLCSAVGLASTQSAGLLEALGTMTKSLHAGKAAAVGFEAATLAAEGLDGPAAPIEGRRGLLALHAGTASDAGASLDGLGSRWELERNEIKPYPCGVVSHSIIDVAVMAGRGSVGVPTSVRLTVHPFVLEAMGATAPSSSLEAKFSATHCFAVGYLRGQAGLAEFSDDAVHDPDVVALRSRCELVADESVPRYGVRAEITDASGSVRHRRRDHPARLDADGVRRKARALVEPVLGARTAGFVALAFDPGAAVADLVAAAAPTA
jgi:2-methylcitrate dehydratase PrpD